MEGRHHQPALSLVALPVEEQQRGAAERELEEDVRLSGPHDIRRSREDLLDRVRVVEEDARRRVQKPKGELVAVAGSALSEVAERVAHVPVDLHRRVLFRAWGKDGQGTPPWSRLNNGVTLPDVEGLASRSERARRRTAQGLARGADFVANFDFPIDRA